MRIFVHGLGQTAGSWGKVLSCLDEEGEHICLELSELLPRGEVTYQKLYNAFCDFCRSMGETADLCGLSLGAVLALNYAMDYPEKVRSLVLIAPQYRMPKNLLRFQNLVFRIMPNSAFRSMGFEKADLIRLCGSMAQLDFRDSLRKVTCPVSVICGEKDWANRKAAVELAASLKNAQLRVIPGAGHELNLEAPEELANLLKSPTAGRNEKDSL